MEQLFTLFRRLDGYVPNRSELGNLVGYCSIARLLDFETTSGSPEEVIFQQVRAVHDGLEQTKRNLAIRKLAYDLICDWKAAVDNRIQPYLAGADIRPEKGFRSGYTKREKPLESRDLLIHEIILRLRNSTCNYEDRIRRDGMSLVETTLRRGEREGTKRILLADYRDLKSCLAGEERKYG